MGDDYDGYDLDEIAEEITREHLYSGYDFLSVVEDERTEDLTEEQLGLVHDKINSILSQLARRVL